MKRLEIEFVMPEEQVLVVDGEEVQISPIRMGRLPLLVRAVEPVFADFVDLIDFPSSDSALRLVGRHGDAVTNVIAICTGLDVKKVDQMLPDRVAALLICCCEVNWDFFVKAAPSLSARARDLAPQLAAKLHAAVQAAEAPAS